MTEGRAARRTWARLCLGALAVGLSGIAGCNRGADLAKGNVPAARHQEVRLPPSPCEAAEATLCGAQCSCDTRHLTFTGLAMSYPKLDQAQAMVLNSSQDKVTLDPGQSGIPVLFRRDPSSGGWEEVETWRCANAGAGTLRELLPGASLPLTVAKSGIYFTDEKTRSQLSMCSGRRPVGGEYVLALRFSLKPWQVLESEHPPCFLAVSHPFQVNG